MAKLPELLRRNRLEKATDSAVNLWADHPAFIFQVVGQSRDDVPTVVQAGGNHPRSHGNTPRFLSAAIQFVQEN